MGTWDFYLKNLFMETLSQKIFGSIYRQLLIPPKKRTIQQDRVETGLRRVVNYSLFIINFYYLFKKICVYQFFFVLLISRCSNDYCKQSSARPYSHANKESAEGTFASCRAYANSTTFFEKGLRPAFLEAGKSLLCKHNVLYKPLKI